MKTLRGLYLAAFVVCFEFGRENWTPGINAWKAVAGATWVQLSLLLAILCWLGDLRGYPLFSSMPTLVLYFIAGALGVVNYHFLVTKGNGTNYEREFHQLPLRKKLVVVVSGVTIIAFCTAALILCALVGRQRLLH